MTNNNLHNLMTQMTQEQKSAWRIEKHYMDESGSDEEKAFWESLLSDKKTHIAELKGLIKSAM
ncbi:MAG: hypothetical protein OEX08_01905 [Candidatus Nomurabacteria bacterium]|nr:hypothetical protein [Candidatus Nomurabacteria bacterium]